LFPGRGVRVPGWSRQKSSSTLSREPPASRLHRSQRPQAGAAAWPFRYRIRRRDTSVDAVARGERPALRPRRFRHEERHCADDVRPLGGARSPRRLASPGDGTAGFRRRRRQRKLARQCAAVLVCEPAGPGGALKTARKGVGSFLMKITGQAAHAGLDFEKGQSAILELAHQIQAISRLTDLKRGVTLNVGVVRGGTRTNVIAAEAVAEVDLRIAKKADGAVMERKIRGLRPANPKCRMEIEGGINRPPMERTTQVVALYELAQKIAGELGFSLAEIAVGGGSDGNFTGGIGIPTLDGLGAVGEGAHATHESVVTAELPRRTALLAGLIEAIE